MCIIHMDKSQIYQCKLNAGIFSYFIFGLNFIWTKNYKMAKEG